MTYMVHPLERSICSISLLVFRFGILRRATPVEVPAGVVGVRASVSAISGPLDGV
jgi:hypothetical protein